MAPSWDAGRDIMRRIAQDGPRPDIARLSDEDETRMSMALSGTGRLTRRAMSAYLKARRVDGGCLMIVGFEGSKHDVRQRRRAVRAMLRRGGAVSLGQRAGAAWEHGRFAGPYLRDSLLDAGVLAETLETAAEWSSLRELYDSVRTALHSSL